MNKLVAEPLLQQELAAIAGSGYGVLVRRVNSEPLTRQVLGPIQHPSRA